MNNSRHDDLMSPHVRDYFVSQIRTGASYISYEDKTIKIFTPTPEESVELNMHYSRILDESIKAGTMTKAESKVFMLERGIWVQEDEDIRSAMEMNLKTLKKEAYNNRKNILAVDAIRKSIDNTRDILYEKTIKLNRYLDRTAEGLAIMSAGKEHIRMCSYSGEDIVDFESVSIDAIYSLYQRTMLREEQLRHLCKTDPWKTIWYLNQSSFQPIFFNKNNRDLSYNQQNMVIWSRMYDSVYESIECPEDYVIDDDILIDGWFIVQKEKRDSEQAKRGIENSRPSHNADEVYVVTKNNEEAKRVNSINSNFGSMIKKQREGQIKKHGEIQQGGLYDVKVRQGKVG